MSTVLSHSRSFIALPLTLAVSTLLISACSNTSAVKNKGAINSSSVITKSPANQGANTGSADYSTAFLDAESLKVTSLLFSNMVICGIVYAQVTA